jgi:hypothetical protein
MTQILSMSLWGNNPKYLVGAMENIKLCATIYPNWQINLYVDSIALSIINSSINKYSYINIIEYTSAGDWNGMFWRFLPAVDSNIEVMISRDCDSRISLRERAAVDEWLSSDKDFHIMRDHPYHNTAILGGMWGCRNNLFNRLNISIEPETHNSFWQVDQNFLREIVYPKVLEYSYIHDNFNHFGEKQRKDFPTPRVNKEFVGEIYDEFNNRHPDHYTMIP